MMLFERRIRFPAAVLCAGPAGVYFASGVEIEGSAEAGLARVRALDPEGQRLAFTVLLDLRHLVSLRLAATAGRPELVLPVGGSTCAAGCDEQGRLILRVQSTVQVERDSLGVLVLAPGPEIPWTIGIHAAHVDEFLSVLEECASGYPGMAVA